MPTVKLSVAGQPLLELDVEQYVAECLNAEMPASWHPEARKAQSIAIRSYALARMAERGWLYADQRDQVWNPVKWEQSATDITAVTTGIVGVYNGKVIPTFYHSACGGHTTDSPFGKQVPYLKAAQCPCGREKAGHGGGMCQYGAKALAEQGKTWREILDTYYKDLQWVGNYGEETVSKLNPHFQRIPDWAKPLWAGCRNEWYKVVLPPIGDPFPGKKGIGRPWIGTATESTEAIEATYIRDGAAGAERYFARLRQYYLDRPYIWAWEGPNEPQPMADAGFRNALDDFTVRWVDLMHSIGKRTVALCLSVGWVDQPEHILGFASALESTDYWALHEYSAPTMQSDQDWHCLRYRRTVQALKDAGHRVPPLLITECGIDGGVISQGRTGWKTHARDEEDYMGQLSWYDREICKDDYVKAAFIFTSGPESEWVDFEVGESLTRKLANHINAGGPLAPSPTDGPTDDEIRNLAWNYLGVPYTPDHAFPQYAREHDLGAPIGDTFDHKGVRIQPFMGGIVKCVIGQWERTAHIKW